MDRTSVVTVVLRWICVLTMLSMRSQLLAADGREVHEVEAQPVRRDQRAGLLDVRAEHLAQRRVQQVRRGVIAARGVTHLVDDLARSTLSPRFSVPLS